jgi:hypothetical protein
LIRSQSNKRNEIIIQAKKIHFETSVGMAGATVVCPMIKRDTMKERNQLCLFVIIQKIKYKIKKYLRSRHQQYK